MKKLLLLFLAMMLNISSIWAQYSWSGYTAGSLTYTTANMNVTISNTNFVNGTPRYSNSTDPHGASCAAAPNGLYLAVDWPNTSGNTTVTINFPTPICAPVTFTIYDINQDYWNDGSTNWFYFTDKVDISALDQSAAAIPAAAITIGNGCGNTVATTGNTRTITGNFNNCLCNSNTITIGSAGTMLSQITFRYYSGPATYSTPSGNPYTQYIVISDFTASVPAAPAATPATICPGSTATLTATSPAGATFNWFTAATGGSSISTGATFTTPVLAANTTYYVQSTNACGVSTRTPVAVTVAAPAAPTAVGTTICSGSTATLNATNPGGVSFDWFTTSTGGSSLFTGASFTTPALTANATYYVQSNGGSCVSTRTAVPVTITSANGGSFATASETTCDPSNITFSALPSSSGATSYTYNWYYQDGLQTCPTNGSAAGWNFITTSTPVLTTIFSDNFNVVGNPPPGGWTTALNVDADIDMNIQVVTNPTTPNVTATCVRFNSSAGDNGDKWDLRRAISTVGYTGISLTFNWYETTNASNDNVEIFYNSGSGWTSTGVVFNRRTALTGFQSKTVNFGSYADNNAAFQIGFRFTNGANGILPATANCYIDDVVLQGTPPPSYDPPGPLSNNRTYAALVSVNGGICNGATTWSSCLQATIDCLLPVEFLYFNAAKENNKHSLLTWATAQEEGNEYFAIERSADGINFTEIGRKEALQGFVNQTRYYDFLDTYPLDGGNYYRLRQVDLDGQEHYSEIKYLEFESSNSFVTVYPNPSKDGVFTIETRQAATVSVLNLLGQELGVHHLQSGQNALVLETAGVFLLRLQFGDKSVKIVRVVVTADN